MDRENWLMRKWTVVGMVVILALLTACRPSLQPTSTPDLQLTLDTSVPFKVGKTSLLVTLTDAQGNPINDAKIEVQGDMSHAGMKPALGSVENGEQGKYTIPFAWTMAGDWIVTIK